MKKMHCRMCGGGIEFKREDTGITIPCPHCGSNIELIAPSKSEKTYERPPASSSKGGGIETLLDVTGLTCMWLGITVFVVTILRLLLDENIFVNPPLTKVVYAAVPMLVGFVSYITTKFMAELVRLLKKLNNIPYSGEISN